MDNKNSYLKPIYILGAGPAGLAAAYTLTKQGIPIVIVEKNNQVGGLSKSIKYQGFIVDYGAHFLATGHPLIKEIFDKILVSDQVTINRLTRFYWHHQYFSYPPQIKELFFNVGLIEVIKIALSYLRYKVYPIDSPQNHAEEIQNKYGKYLYTIFFKDYLEKVWGCSCERLAVDSVTGRANGFFKIWIKTLLRKITSLFNSKEASKNYEYQFQYPKLGLGQFYEGIADYLRSKNQKILLNTKVIKLYHKHSTITQIVLKNCQTDKITVHDCEQIISSIPISLMLEQITPSAPKEIIITAKSLKFRNTILVYLIIEGSQIFPEHCLYINDSGIQLVRVTNYANWSSYTMPNSYQTPVCCEYWCDFHEKIWSLSEQELLEKAENELRKIKIIDNQKISGGFIIKLPRTNPVYNINYKEKKSEIQKYIDRFSNLQIIGRGGSFSYLDQDRVLLMGVFAAKKLIDNKKVIELTDYQDR